jgi:hypothetical protein
MQFMGASARWFAMPVAVLLFSGAAVWKTDDLITQFPRDSRTAIRVLKVSLGTNHVFSLDPNWRQYLRALLPKPLQNRLGPFQPYRFQTRYDSLMVWVGGFDRSDEPIPWLAVDNAAAVLSDGTMAKGREFRCSSNIVALQFSCFSRDAKQIKFSLNHGSNRVMFSVRNPHPVQPADWRGKGLPQTNLSFNTKVILKSRYQREDVHQSGNRFPVALRAFALGGGDVGWLQWRLTMFDALGNWTETTPFESGINHVPALPASRADWKIIAEAQEYISAGFVTQPAHGQWTILNVNARAKSLGVASLVLFGPGLFTISGERNVRALAGPETPAMPSLLGRSDPGQLPTWELSNPHPIGILCICAPNVPANIRARLRERTGASGGRIFANLPKLSFTNSLNEPKQIANLFSPRLPNDAKNLEVEIIALLPPTEFFIAPFDLNSNGVVP